MMKKKSMIFLAAVLLLGALGVPGVRAAEILTLPAAACGAAYRYDFAPVAGGREFGTEGILPDGLQLLSGYDEESGLGSFWLSGTPAAAGEYSFAVNVSDGSGTQLTRVECALSVAEAAQRAEMPVISEQPASLTVRDGQREPGDTFLSLVRLRQRGYEHHDGHQPGGGNRADAQCADGYAGH